MSLPLSIGRSAARLLGLLIPLALGCRGGAPAGPARLELHQVDLDISQEHGLTLAEHWRSTNLPFPIAWCVVPRALEDGGRGGVTLQLIARVPDGTRWLSRTEGWSSAGTGPDWATPLDASALFLDPVTGVPVGGLDPHTDTSCDRRTQTIVALADGGFAVTFKVMENSQDVQLQLARFGADGALQWNRLLPYWVGYSLSAVAELSTGELVAAWSRHTPEGENDARFGIWTPDGDEVSQGSLVFPDGEGADPVCDSGDSGIPSGFDPCVTSPGSHFLQPFSIVPLPGGDFTVVGYTYFARMVDAPDFCAAQGFRNEAGRCRALRYFAAAARFDRNGALRWVTHSGGEGGDVVDADHHWYQPGFEPSRRAARWGEDGVVIVGRMDLLLEHQVDPAYGIAALWVDGEGRIRSGVRACPCRTLLEDPPNAYEPLDAAEDGTLSMVVSLGQQFSQRFVQLSPDGDFTTVRSFRTLRGEGGADLEQVRPAGDGWLGLAFSERFFVTLE